MRPRFWIIGLLIGAAPGLAQTTVGGPITSDTTWTLALSPYLATSTVTVNSGVTLTVEPGVLVRFQQNTRLSVNGRLLANGTAANPITFTSSQTSPAAGDWDCIRLHSGASPAPSQISRATISYAGDDSTCNAALSVEGGSPSLSHVTISSSSRHGLRVSGATPTFSSGTLSANAWAGARVDDSSTLTISGTSIVDNSDYAISKSLASHVLGLSGMTITGNGGGSMNGILHGGGTLTTSTTFAGGVEWHLNEGLQVGAGAGSSTVLTIQPGAVVRLGTNRWINVFGTLMASGSPASPTLFTSMSATPAPGDWAGLHFRAGAGPSASSVSFATVAYGGGTSSLPAAVMVDGSSPTFEHVAVRDSSRGGMRTLASASPILTNCSFTANASGGIQNETPATAVRAAASYWGAASGPSGSGPGSGQSISTGVTFEPWLVDEPGIDHYVTQVVSHNRTFNPDLQVHHRLPFELNMIGAWELVYRNGAGNVVRTLAGEDQTGDPEWDGRDDSGALLPDGTYSFELASTAEGPRIATIARGPAIKDSGQQLTISGLGLAPQYFSPNGNGVQETTTFSGDFSFDTVSWQVAVKNSSNAVVRLASGEGSDFAFTWDGRNGGGVLQPDGLYNFELTAAAGTGSAQDSRSATLDVTAPVATISSPTPAQVISNIFQSGATSFPVTGDATDVNLQSWILSAQLEPNAWSTLGSGTSSTSGQLALWQTSNAPNGTYHLRLESADLAGNGNSTQFDVAVGNFKATQDRLQFDSTVGESVIYSSTIPFTVQEHLRIVDESGAVVRTLFNGSRNAGAYNDPWNGARDNGTPAPDGGYFYLATLTSGSSSYTWDLSNQYWDNFSSINDSVVIDPFDPFNNAPMSFTYNFAQPARVTICFSDSNGSIPSHCNPPHYCLKDAVYEESGPHTIEWAGVDESGAVRGDLKTVGVVAFRTEFPLNVVVHYGTKPVITNLRLDPPVFGPAVGQQQISFDLETYQDKPVDVRIEYMNQESESVLATLDFSEVLPGTFTDFWGGRADNGMNVAPGAYTMTLTVTDVQGNVLKRRLLTRVQY